MIEDYKRAFWRRKWPKNNFWGKVNSEEKECAKTSQKTHQHQGDGAGYKYKAQTQSSLVNQLVCFLGLLNMTRNLIENKIKVSVKQ